jgi:hypothetical protein
MDRSDTHVQSQTTGRLSATVEGSRLDDDGRGWRRWGPYLAERAWGTVREDYSEHGNAWEYFSHDDARSRTYRWNEDGLGGISDDRQILCFAWAFWNGRDPILKERIFGLTGNEGNHGEDAKEYWWYLDNTPTHSFMKWRYWYPQAEFPYADLVNENRMRTKYDSEYELVDTGTFDEDRYWDIEATFAKADENDICIRLRVTNRGPDAAEVDVLPTLWFRNTWSWGLDDERPVLRCTTDADGPRLTADHSLLGRMVLRGEASEPATPLACDNETNNQRLFGVDGAPFPKDGINDHLLHGADTVNPEGTGTKAALHRHLVMEAGETREVRLRLSPTGAAIDDTWSEAMRDREADADELYGALTPEGTSAEKAIILRQALAGMLWSKQYFHFDVERWLDGDPTGPPPPEARKTGRNADWRHLNNADVITMPDTWEYPWYATWDLAFHCVALANVDPEFAKRQLLLMCREWFMHPNGQLPAYEWAFGDVNPPVHAWAALRVFEIDGSRDHAFLERIMHKLLLNFTWWVNRKDAEGNNVFEGGFLGLDNIGPIDRSAHLPIDGVLEQADGTAWMAMYCLNMLELSIVLSEHDDTYEDLAQKFFEHFAYIATAMHERGLWDDEDGFYYDVLHHRSGERQSVRSRSMVGLLPLAATTSLGRATLDRLPQFARGIEWFAKMKPRYSGQIMHTHTLGTDEGRLLSVVTPDHLRRLLDRMLDPQEFLSEHGLRALSRFHRDHPFELRIGDFSASVDYEPAESTSGLFGGNSNWRGPIWFPVNYLLIESLRRFARYFGDDFTAEHPQGSGVHHTLVEIADDLAERLIALFLDDASGRRPVHGDNAKFHHDPEWHSMIPFHEYFHGDTGAGLGASHQTGWTGLVANLIINAKKGN